MSDKRLTEFDKEKAKEQLSEKKLRYNDMFYRLRHLENCIDYGALVKADFIGNKYHRYISSEKWNEFEIWEIVSLEIKKDNKKILHFLVNGEREESVDFSEIHFFGGKIWAGMSFCDKVLHGGECIHISEWAEQHGIDKETATLCNHIAMMYALGSENCVYDAKKVTDFLIKEKLSCNG